MLLNLILSTKVDDSIDGLTVLFLYLKSDAYGYGNVNSIILISSDTWETESCQKNSIASW